jgi:glycosyltransferase involved in cell wall biosynthesis
MRTASVQARDLLASLATKGQLDWACLRAEVMSASPDDPRTYDQLFPLAATPHVLTLARVVALQHLQEGDRKFGHALYRILTAKFGLEVLKDRHAKLAADLAYRLSDYAFAERIRASGLLSGLDRACLAADLANPFVLGGQETSDWLGYLNYQFHLDGVAPILLSDSSEGQGAFDRLGAAVGEPVLDGPLVTVVITTWCPGAEFISAFRSITSQTWQNLEILVIDDCSPAEYHDFTDSVVAEDARARLIRMPANGGTYLARNRGLREAAGEIFAVHDSDDWAHPERIERQVRVLEQHPELLSTSSRALRLDDNLTFCLPGVSASRENASSLMFWRRKAIDGIGYYDASRKGADTEYAVRLHRRFGEASHKLMKEHLACIRLTFGSLSREEFRPGWRHPSRSAYRRGYLWWHQRASSRSGALVNHGSVHARCFPDPIPFMPDRDSARAKARKSWDVVYMLDAREGAELPCGALDELVALADAGLAVAVMHVESLLHPFVKEFETFSDDVQELIARRRIGEVLPTDSVSIATLVVRDPSCLQFSDDEAFPFTAKRVFVVPDYMPRSRPKAFDCSDVSGNVVRKVGVAPVWLLPPGEDASQWNSLDAVPRGWIERVAGRYRYGAPRPGLPPFGDQLNVAYVCEELLPEVAAEVRALAEAVNLRVWVLGEGPRESQAPAPAPARRFTRDALPDDTDVALVDVVVLNGGPDSPMARAVALAAAASGCIVVLHGGAHGPEAYAAGLEFVRGGLTPWLRDFLSSPHRVDLSRRQIQNWLEENSGRNDLIKQLAEHTIEKAEKA